MSSILYTVFLIVASIIAIPIPDVCASTINDLDVPLVVRNGTGPIDLSCNYEIQEKENGLVIKWYHEMDQIYQWIPPMPPQDVGVIKGLTQYPEENLKDPNSRSIIRLKVVTIEMGGEYTCTISTFQGEDTKKSKMIVYLPETKAVINVLSFNETHLNLTCTVVGAQPRPSVSFYVEGVRVNDSSDRIETIDSYTDNLSVKQFAIVRNPLEPMLVDCVISIPETDYKRRERMIYYPRSNARLAQKSSGVGIYKALFNSFVVILFAHALA